MRAFRVSVWVAVFSALVAGCGGGDSSSGAAVGSSEPAPLEGKELRKASQLTGTWLATTDGDFVGFEFMKDNKVLATHAMQAAFAGAGSGMMMTYDIMEGGRLSLTSANGQTQVYTVTVKGDKLELRGSMMFASTDFQQFRKLSSGQTLEQAIKEEEAAQAKAARERYDAVAEFLEQPGLVIVCTTPGPGAPVSVAIAPADASGSQKAWHDDSPPHLDQISVRPSIEDSGKKAVAHVVFGPQIDPPPTQGSRGGSTIAFEIVGDARKPTAIAKVSYGGANYELELKRDEKLYKQIVARFDAEKQRIEDLKKPLVAMLQDFVVLEGDSHSEYPNQPKPNKAQISLARDEKTGAYAGEAILIDAQGRAAPLPNTTAQITVINDAPMLMINAYNRQYQLSLDAATGRFTGGWFYQNNPNGFQANLAIVSAEDAATRAKRVEGERQALLSINANAPLVGLINHTVQFLPKPTSVSLALSPAANGQLTGTATFPVVRAVIDAQAQIVDTLAGPRLRVQFGTLRESGSRHAGHLGNGLRNQAWTFQLAPGSTGGKALQFTDGAWTLTQTDAAAATALRKQLVDALGSGMTLAVRHPANPNNAPPLTFQFKGDGNGKLTGKTIGGTMLSGFDPQSTVQGEVQDNGNLPFLVIQVANPPPARAGAFHRTYTSEMVAYPTPDGWVFTGRYWPDTNASALSYYDLVEVGG